jgi:pyruvate formate lyase activating enzyme
LFKIPISVEEIFSFLELRKKQLDAVVITGGEPTCQDDIEDFIYKIKTIGYLIKLDTNGSNPQILKSIIDKNLIDFIAMDIKAPFDKYSYLTCVPVDIEKIRSSIDIIKNSKIKFEFRTTYDTSKLFPSDIERIKVFFKEKNYRIQNCNSLIK